jgi:glutaredoxin
MKWIFALIAAVALGTYLISDNRSEAQAVANADVEIYTRSCGECKRAKEYMRAHDIAFVERDVEGDIEMRREFYARGGKGVPWIFVHGVPMEGFDVTQFERLRAQHWQ